MHGITNSPAANGGRSLPMGGYTDRDVCNIPKMELLGPMVLAVQTCTNGLTDRQTDS